MSSTEQAAGPKRPPRFSIVIPTRDRAQTLAHALRTCIAQEGFDDYEIVVCDNHSSPATRAVVDGEDCPRLRYLRTDRALAMSENWEFAVSFATGEYVTVLGDDDGLMPYALRELDRLAAAHDRPAAIHWHRGLYTWPTIRVPEDADYLRLPMRRSLEVLNGREQLLRASRYEIGADMLPMIYCSVVRRDVLDSLRQRSGRLFPNLYPDIYSGYALAHAVGTYVSVGIPMGIAGLSGSSNGVATLLTEDGARIREDFFRLNRQAGFGHHPTVPDLMLMPIHADDSFQHAKDRLFPDDPELTLDRRRMVERYLAAIPDTEEAARAGVRAAIRTSLADRPDLLDWFDSLPDPGPAAPFRLKPSSFGFDGAVLALGTEALDVQDIAGAVRLSSALLGFGPDGIVYDGDAPHAPPSISALPRPGVAPSAMVPRVTYARNGEDVVLWRALGAVENGFYVDIGARDPTWHSVTKVFYDRGWNGVNVERSRKRHERLARERPRDLNLNFVVAARAGAVALRDLGGTGLYASEASPVEAASSLGQVAGDAPTIALADLFASLPNRHIHVLKVGVDASEGAVPEAGEFERFRPWVVLIEATGSEGAGTAWERVLLTAGYLRALVDGLNTFLVAEERRDLLPVLSIPANVLDRFQPAAAVEAARRESALHGELQAATTERDALRAQLSATEAERARVASVAADLERETASLRNERDALLAAVRDHEARSAAPVTTPAAPPPVSAQTASPTRRLARLAYRLVRPFSRPVLHRLRTFMAAPQMAEIGRLRSEVQDLRAAFATDGARMTADDRDSVPEASAGHSAAPAAPLPASVVADAGGLGEVRTVAHQDGRPVPGA